MFLKKTCFSFIIAIILCNWGVLSSAKTSKEDMLSDQLTVSGRYALPKANASLHNILIVSQNVDTGSAAKTLKLQQEAFSPILRKAFKKSLSNYQYTTLIETSDAIDKENIVFLSIAEIQFSENDIGYTSNVTLAINSPRECLVKSPSASFTAIKTKDTQKGRKAFALVSGIALTLINPYNPGPTTMFIGSQFKTATQENAVKHLTTSIAEGQGYPPSRKKKKAQRYAMKNAIRLAFAQYIVLIHSACH